MGGLPDAAPDPQDLDHFDIKVDKVSRQMYYTKPSMKPVVNMH